MDQQTRNLLQNATQRARRILETDIVEQLGGTFDILPDGTLAAKPGPHLSPDQKLVRQRLVEAVRHRAGGSDDKARLAAAVGDYTREAAFTVLNRFVALKMLEARGLVQQCVSRGDQSSGFKEFTLLAPGLATFPDKGYRLYLECVFDELSVEVKVLFDRHDPASLIWPRRQAFDDLLAILNGPDLAAVWGVDETIGWVYQYFNSQEERRAMRDASQAPRNSRELAVRNQFFTPRYVVQFLTDNTLGRTWYEMRKGQTKLVQQCEYLVRRPIEVFLNAPDEHLPEGARPWVRSARSGDFSNLPDDPTEDELMGLSLAFNGYDVAERLDPGQDFSAWASATVEAYEAGGALPTCPLRLWLLLFWLQRSHRMITSGTAAPPEFIRLWRDVYFRWREAVTRTDHESQEDALKAPIFVPHRPKKDPRDIKILDPASGSGHFLLYAFDLLLTIYDEAWEGGELDQADFGVRARPDVRPETVRLKSGATRMSNYANQPVPAEDAFLVVAAKADPGDGVVGDYPYVVASSTRFRVPFKHRVRLAEFDYGRAVLEGWFSPSAGEEFIQVVGCFDFEGVPVLGEVEAYRRFRAAIPGLILRHNLHGIDIDPRCAQIAALALWMRAQRAFNDFGLSRATRPPVDKSNIVCAEPMPGEKDLLREFVEQQFSLHERPAFALLLERVFDLMSLAGEAGALLHIEEEIRSVISEARSLAHKQAVPRQGWLFSGDQDPVQLESDLREVNEEQFWQTAEQRIYNALETYARQAEDGNGFPRRLFADDAAQGFAFADLCRKRYDVVVMNPPFGEFSVNWKEQAKKSYPLSSNDILAAFVERFIRTLAPRGFVGAITSRTCFFLLSFQQWRENVVLGLSSPVTIADLGQGVMDAAMVEAAAYVLANVAVDVPMACVRLLKEREKQETLLDAVVGIREHRTPNSLFFVRPSDFQKVPGSPFCYWVGSHVRDLFVNLPPFDSGGREAKQGLATGDDFRFARAWWEVNTIGLVTMPIGADPKAYQVATQGRVSWCPFAKGGAFSPFYQDLNLVVRWTNDGYEIRNFVDPKTGAILSRYRGADRYFQAGFTYADRAASRFCPRILPEGAIISVKGSGIYCGSVESRWSTLAVLTSHIFTRLMDLLLGRVELAKSYQVNTVGRVPWPDIAGNAEKVLRLAAIDGWKPKYAADRSETTSHAFVLPPLISSREVSLRMEQVGVERAARERESKLDEIQARIDQIALAGYGLSEADFSAMEQSFLGTEGSHLNTTNGTPDDVPDASPIQQLADYMLGTVFGRWDIRYATGERPAPELPDPFSPLPVCPPGMLQGDDGLPLSPEVGRRLRAEGRYPLDVAWDGVLVDDPEHPRDLGRDVHTILAVLWGDRADAAEHEACELLGVPTLRAWFRQPAGFFADHLKRYSKSRRQAPIYWPLATLSASYTVWLYAHRVSGDTLFRVQKLVEEKLEHEQRNVAGLKNTAGASPTAGQRKDLEAAEGFVAELATMLDEVRRVAPLWKPDLDDGVVLVLAPLWRLFPQHRAWQAELKGRWDGLCAGEYDWAHVAMHLWPERVVSKCRADRSLAIAHGLEDAFWEDTQAESDEAAERPSDGGEEGVPAGAEMYADGEPAVAKPRRKVRRAGGKQRWVPRTVDAKEVERLIAGRTNPAVKAALKSLMEAPTPGGKAARKPRAAGGARKKGAPAEDVA